MKKVMVALFFLVSVCRGEDKAKKNFLAIDLDAFRIVGEGLTGEPEYYWRVGRFSGMGFAELAREEKFMVNMVSFLPMNRAKFFAITAEVDGKKVRVGPTLRVEQKLGVEEASISLFRDRALAQVSVERKLSRKLRLSVDVYQYFDQNGLGFGEHSVLVGRKHSRLSFGFFAHVGEGSESLGLGVRYNLR